MVILTATIVIPFEQLPFNFFYQKLFEWKKKRCMYHLTNREALTVLCSVVKHAGSGQSTKEVQRETRDVVECFSTLYEYLTVITVILSYSEMLSELRPNYGS